MCNLPPIAGPLSQRYAGLQAYRRPGEIKWLPLTDEAHLAFHALTEVDELARDAIRCHRSAITELLSASLQYSNVGFFAGSGTSLGAVNGPSMQQLWAAAMCTPGTGSELTNAAKEICDRVRYSEHVSPNIEHFLSQCDAYLSFNQDVKTQTFVIEIKAKILDLCSNFLNNPGSDISAYRHILQKLARRRVRDPRLKIFTTNYDMSFETAASDLGMMVVDGFSYTRKRRFDGRHFTYDVVRRDGDTHDFLEGIFHLHKLHGSVSWERQGSEIFEVATPHPEHACLIYPATGKYQQTFIQPHLELLSRFLDFLRKPNTCLVVSGFGFNDDHLSEPILSAIQSNPSLRLILTDYSCIQHVKNEGTNSSSVYWKKFADLSTKGFDIHFIGGSFADIVNMIPSMRAVTPAEQLVSAIKRIGSAS